MSLPSPEITDNTEKGEKDDRDEEQRDEGGILQGIGAHSPALWPSGAHKRPDRPFLGEKSRNNAKTEPLNAQKLHLHINQG